MESVRSSGALRIVPPHSSPSPERDVQPEWSPARRVLFRFVFAYLFIYIFPFPLDYLGLIPHGEVLVKPYADLWNALVPWVGKHLFHVAITVQPNGSGDTTYNYVQIVCFLVIALTATVVWTILDRKRRNYSRLSEWLHVYVRFSLATAMISYGGSKVIKSQFPSPPIGRLLQPFGDASPMGLLWTFMGASTAYTVFAGASEMIGGLLLTARRTALLGALVTIGVMGNVVMLNFSYDVPVKLYSAHLLAMAVFLAAPDLRRLVNFFVLNRNAEPAPIRPLFQRAGLQRGALVLRTVFVTGCVCLALYQAFSSRSKFGDGAPRSPLRGIWNVEEIETDGQVRPPVVMDEARWRRLVFDYPGTMSIQLMNDSRLRYNLKLDAAKGSMVLIKRDDPNAKFSFAFQQPAPDVMTLQGVLEGHKIRTRLLRKEAQSFLLTSRGFHWINEYPFNR